MRKVPNGNLPLLINGGQERSAIIDTEVKDAVLIGSLKGHTEDGRISRMREGFECEAVEGREHAELKLNNIIGGGDEGDEAGLVIF